MKKIIAIILCLMLSFSLCIAAEEGLSVSALLDSESGKVIISGVGYGAVVLYVMPYEKNSEDYSASELPIDVIGVNCDGEYKVYSYLPSSACGKLKVVATDMQGNEAEAVFMFADFNVSDEDIKAVNDAKTNAQLRDAIENISQAVGVDTEDEFYKENASTIYRIHNKIRSEYEDVTEIYEDINTALALAKFSDSDKGGCEEILRSCELYLGISYQDDYVNDERLTDEVKKELSKILSEEDYASSLDNEVTFAMFFENAKALAAINAAEKWQDIRDVIEEDFKELFDLEDTSVKLQSVYSKMMNYDYNTFEDIEKGYEKAVKSLKKPQSSGGSSKSGGGSFGGGSSGGIGVSPNADIKLPETSNEVEEVKKEMVILPEKAESAYYDVKKEHWGYNAVSRLSAAGVIKGYGDGKFLPNNVIARAEFTKLIAISFALSEKKAVFSDVADDVWYNGVVGAAADKGFILGYEGKFSPDSPISRQDAIVICYRALKSEGIILSGNADFEDNMNISVYALSAVGAFKEYGIVKGDGKNFNPHSKITRAEAAQLLMGVLDTAASYKGV